MKYSKYTLFLYAICLLKIVATITACFFMGAMIFVSVRSFFVLLGIALEKSLVPLSLIGLGVLVAVWLAILTTAMIGIKVKRMRRISIVLIGIAFLFDLVLPLFFSVPILKILCSVLFAAELAIGIKSFINEGKT